MLQVAFHITYSDTNIIQQKLTNFRGSISVLHLFCGLVSRNTTRLASINISVRFKFVTVCVRQS